MTTSLETLQKGAGCIACAHPKRGQGRGGQKHEEQREESSSSINAQYQNPSAHCERDFLHAYETFVDDLVLMHKRGHKLFLEVQVIRFWLDLVMTSQLRLLIVFKEVSIVKGKMAKTGRRTRRREL